MTSFCTRITIALTRNIHHKGGGGRQTWLPRVGGHNDGREAVQPLPVEWPREQKKAFRGVGESEVACWIGQQAVLYLSIGSCRRKELRSTPSGARIYVIFVVSEQNANSKTLQVQEQV